MNTGAKPKPKAVKPRSNKKNILLYNRRGETRVYLILSFLLPFLIMWYFFAKNEVYPFGDKQILVTDLWHQYYPFFRVEHEKLQNFSSFLYSWDAGLGTNFISLMSYYAASPLNLLAIFFPIEYSREAMTLFLTFKIGFAGLFFAVFLKHTFNKNDISLTAFALCYALCDYIMGYYWNIIWMDTVALLPLVVLGTVKLYREGKYKTYVISLALSLMTSFYIGLFTCIFTVMVFGALVIIDWGGFKNAFKRLGQIVGATAIGLGLAAVILIPAYLGLKLTYSINNKFPEDITFYEPWRKMISAVVGFHEPTAKEGLPNFYCGMFAVVLLGAFIRLRGIKIREKIVTILYLAFIIVSCNMNVLNFMWHGFHFTNMLPYRFSFLLSFILLAAGYRAFTVMKENGKIFDIIAMSAMTFIIALVSNKQHEDKIVITNVVVCFIYVVAMFIYERKLIKPVVLNYAVFVVCFAEMCVNASIGVKTVTVTDHVSYPRRNEDISALINDAESKDKDFFRLETTTNYSINDPALYGYRGVAQFSSTANVNVTNLMHSLGINASDIANRYYYNQNTAVFNAFTCLKYIISTDSYSGDLTYLDPTAEQNGTALYTNNHWLPLGFTAENSIIDYEGVSDDPIENQNELFRLATGIEDDVLKKVEIKNVGHESLNVLKTGYGTYNFQYNQAIASGECYLKYNYTLPSDGPVYAVFDFTDVSNVKIKSEESVLHTHSISKYRDIFAAGDFKAGETMTLQADVDPQKSGSGVVYVYQMDKDVFEEGYKKLSAGGLNIEKYSDTRISGNITAANDCVMYTSIPYDGGWKVYVDGKKTDVKALRNAFLCVPLTAGEHKIELKYTPPGFVAGLSITVFAAAVFILLWVFEPKIKKISEERAAKTSEKEAENNAES